MGIIDDIAAIPLFGGLPREYHEDLATIVVERDFKRGHIIFSEGEEATGFYVLITGRVKISKIGLEGKEQILHIFGPGEPIGEVAVFEGRRFPAHAQTLEGSRVFFFPRTSFVGLIRKDPSLAMNMLAVLSRRLRQFTKLVEDLSLKEVPARLAAYLLYLSQMHRGRSRVALDISKGQLASLLGTIPETLSRILTRMTREGLIEADGSRHIRILQPEGLEALARGSRRLS